jgi:chemotaxis protein MotB
MIFDPGSAEVNLEGRDAVLFIGAAIQLVLDQVEKIKIEGHTDSVPQNSWMYPDNWQLSAARANAVRAFLEVSGITVGPGSPRIEVVALADTVPIGDNDTQEGKAANRRVEIYITRADLVQEVTEPGYDSADNAGAEETGESEEDAD